LNYFAAIAITSAPWITQFTWRFSLRTLLIVVMLVAAALRAMIYAAR
jgi:hypothetical protein